MMMQNHHYFLIVLLHFRLCLAQDSNATTQVNISSATSVPVQLNCSEGTNVTWYYKRPGSSTSELVEANASILNITSSRKVGLYSCLMENTTLRNFEAYNFSAPVIPHTGSSIKFTTDSVNQTISCISFSYPPPTFVWSVRSDGSDSEKLLPNSSLSNIVVTDDRQGTSTLRFASVAKSHRGTYFCNATNAVSNESVSILLRVRDRLAPLYPCIGIICEIIVVAAIIYAIRKKAALKQKQFGIRFEELDSSEGSQEDRNSGVRFRNTGQR